MGISDRGGAASQSWDGHLLLLHPAETDRRSMFSAWARRGLERGEKIVYAYADHGAGGPSLRQWVPAVLEADGVAVAEARAEGQLIGVAMPAVCGLGDLQQMVDQALAEGFRGVRITGDVAEVLTVMPDSAHVRVERLLDALCASRPASVLCHGQRRQLMSLGEPLDGSPGEIIELHPRGIREPLLATSGDEHHVVLAGEVDISNERVLEHAVRGAADQADGVLWLDLTRLTFLSCGGCRALAIGSEPFRNRGGTVRLAASRPPIDRLVRIFGLDRLAGISVTEPPDAH